MPACDGDGLKQLRRSAIVSLATFCAGLLLAAASASRQAENNRAHATEAFDALARGVVDKVSAHLWAYQYGVRGARGALASSGIDEPGRDAFHRYSIARDTDFEFKGANGFGIIRRVRQEEVAAFVARARSDGWPEFDVRQLSPHDGERFVIEYIEPVSRNRAAVGLDIASEENRREAALQAARTGEATLTGPITLVQATGMRSRSFLLLLPIYRPGVPLDTVAQREAAAIGWSYAPLIIDRVLQSLGLDGNGGDERYTLSLRDVAGADTREFYGPAEVAATATGRTNALTGLRTEDLRRVIDLPIYGRTWQASFHATPQFIESLALIAPGATGSIVALVQLPPLDPGGAGAEPARADAHRTQRTGASCGDRGSVG